MSAVLIVRRYKDKNYLAKTFIVSRNFCKNTHFFFKKVSLIATFYPQTLLSIVKSEFGQSHQWW
jgi:hypothetical protein